MIPLESQNTTSISFLTAISLRTLGSLGSPASSQDADCCLHMGLQVKNHDSSAMMTFEDQLGECLILPKILQLICRQLRLLAWVRRWGHMTQGLFFSLRNLCRARCMVTAPRLNWCDSSLMVTLGVALVTALMWRSTSAVYFIGLPVGFTILKSAQLVKDADIQRWTVVLLRACPLCRHLNSRRISQCLYP